MTASIRILLADDSAAVRRLVTSTLSKHPDIEVVGAARHGQEALELLPITKPNVILLDVEMPVMDGIDTLKNIRKIDRQIPIVMFSSLTVRGGEATLEALELGASDYVAKPTSTGHVQQAIDYIDRELVPKLRQWKRRPPAVQTKPTASRTNAAVASLQPRPRKIPGPINVIAIGSSTGGPNALAAIVSRLPANLSVPVLIVQHMPTVFTRLLAERLNQSSHLTVAEAYDGAVVQPGQVWVAAGGQHMVTERKGTETRLRLSNDAMENSCRPSVDVLFRSVSEAYEGQCMAVVLTGMGKDGTEGCRELSKKGATIVVQDEASCVVWGMPRAVTEAGLADKTLPLDQIHLEITCAARSKSRSPVPV